MRGCATGRHGVRPAGMRAVFRPRSGFCAPPRRQVLSQAINAMKTAGYTDADGTERGFRSFWADTRKKFAKRCCQVG